MPKMTFAKAGVATGEALQADRNVMAFVIVPLRTWKNILLISERAREIIIGFSCTIEPYGIDESWIDCNTGSVKLFGMV